LKNKIKFLKNIKAILIATNNSGKFIEIKSLLPQHIKFLSPKEFNLQEPEESGRDFKSNALIKAAYCSSKTRLVSIADDSGLEIDVLDGMPGIYSARWAGDKKDFRIGIKKIYSELRVKKFNKIKARFVCALAIFFPCGFSKVVEGYVYGSISLFPKGNNGFGYDPIFIPNNYTKTFGEMSSTLKERLSHRNDAFKKIKKFFKYL